MYYVCFQMYVVSPSRPPYILSRFQKKHETTFVLILYSYLFDIIFISNVLNL